MANGKAAVLAAPTNNRRPKNTLTSVQPPLILYWGGQDIRTLKRAKLLEIIGELGTEVKELREKNIQLERRKFYPR
ncbi:hypothetical protein STRZYGA_00200 [Brevundimonas phage vB_BpoS-Strzyga]|nr:hypothetical protein STRZYGA_00200 [Brevundimonas phage vB_BpoS-Strzyga]